MRGPLRGGETNTGNPCPVCGVATSDYHHYMDGWLIEESGEECPNGHYGYTYAYGNSQWQIGTIDNYEEFIGWYGDANEERLVRDTAMNAAIAKHKQLWAAQSAGAPKPEIEVNRVPD